MVTPESKKGGESRTLPGHIAAVCNLGLLLRKEEGDLGRNQESLPLKCMSLGEYENG